LLDAELVHKPPIITVTWHKITATRE